MHLRSLLTYACVQCIQELCEEAFIESCFEELFEEEDQFAEELEQFLSSLTQEQVGNLVCQLDAVSLSDSNPSSNADITSKVFSPLHCLQLYQLMIDFMLQLVCTLSCLILLHCYDRSLLPSVL